MMRLIDAHPEAACSGEGHYFDRLHPMLRDVFEKYQRILDLDAKLVFSENPVLSPIRMSHVDALLRAFILERFAEHDPEGRAKAHGDKTPLNWKGLSVLLRVFPGAKIIVINRDPRDAAVSLFGHARRRQMYKLDPEGPIDKDKLIAASCRNWLGVNTALRQMREKIPDQLIAVRYEDLLADTLGEYRRVCEGLGLSCETALLQTAVDACDFSQMSGRARGEKDSTSFFTSGTSGGWRKELTGDQANHILDACADFMKEAGYSR